MNAKLLTEHHLEFLSLKKEAAEARQSLHLSKCQIVGDLMPRLIFLPDSLIYSAMFLVHKTNINYLKGS